MNRFGGICAPDCLPEAKSNRQMWSRCSTYMKTQYTHGFSPAQSPYEDFTGFNAPVRGQFYKTNAAA